MRKTIYEIVDNRTGKLIETFSFSVSIKSGLDSVCQILDDKTGELIQTSPFSIRVRVRITDIDEYKKTHVLLDRLE